MLTLLCILLTIDVISSLPLGKLSPLDLENGRRSINPQASFFTFKDEYRNISELPPCETACGKPVVDLLSVFLVPGDMADSMKLACRQYDDASKCMKPLTHCTADSMFYSLTSGLQYMCEEQKEAFDMLIDCIDASSLRIKRDCDLQCQPATLLAGMAVKDTVMDVSLKYSHETKISVVTCEWKSYTAVNFPEMNNGVGFYYDVSLAKLNNRNNLQQLDQPLVKGTIDMRTLIEPHMSRLFLSESCRIGRCLMSCYKAKYNMMCEGTAGHILMEALTRPLSSESSGSSSFSAQFLKTFMGSIMPLQCALPVQSGKSYKIDQELNREIKRMYHNKRKTTAEDVAMSVAAPIVIENPFETNEDEFLMTSPFEQHEDVMESSGEFPML